MWNVALDQDSNPSVIGGYNGNRGILTIRSDQMDSVQYETGFYALGHFSKFVDPNAYRINSNTFDDVIENVAFLNPDNTIAVIVYNKKRQNNDVKVQWRNMSFTVTVSANSAATLVFRTV